MPSDATTREFDIRAYAQVLLRRKLIIASALVLVVVGAYVQSNAKTRLYSATGEIIFTRRSTAGAIEGTFNDAGANPLRKLATDVRLITSSEVRRFALTFYRDAGAISASAASDTDIIAVSSVSAIPEQTDRTVTAYMRAFIEYRRDAAAEDVLQAGKILNGRIERLKKQVSDLDGRIARTPEGARDQLLGQRASLTGQQELARQQIDRMQEAASFQDTTRILTQPSTPVRPFEPNPRKAATQALPIGLVLGIGLAFLRETLDDSIKSREDLEQALGSIPVLGAIPSQAPKPDPNEVTSLTRPDSATAEAYRSLRTSIQFMGVDRPIRTLQVTSPVASEGKTTTVANLAVALASIGQRVVVVCCDLRRPRIHEMFGLSNEVGFTSVLLGDVQLPAALQPVEGVPRLLVLASGKPPPNPAELLAGPRSEKLFAALAETADIVLVDSPPVLPVTDAAVIAKRVDATILVASAATSVRKRVAHAVAALEQVDSHLVGAVLNEAPRGADGYGYGYGYGYGGYRDEAAEGSPRKRFGRGGQKPPKPRSNGASAPQPSRGSKTPTRSREGAR